MVSVFKLKFIYGTIFNCYMFTVSLNRCSCIFLYTNLMEVNLFFFIYRTHWQEKHLLPFQLYQDIPPFLFSAEPLTFHLVASKSKNIFQILIASVLPVSQFKGSVREK